MGLDASVRCRCFEEHRLKPGPVPYEDLYIDCDGYLVSRKLDEAHTKYDHRQYLARYEQLDDEFRKWMDCPCEHERSEYCSERITNWAGVSAFRDRVEDAGGEAEYPLLSHLLPDGNGGVYPVELAEPTLVELDRFIAKVSDVDEWVLCADDTEDEVWSSTDNGSFTWMCSFNQRIGMCGGKIFFDGPDSYIQTTHFRQEPIGKPDAHGSQRMRIVCLDQDAQTTAFDSIGPQGTPKVSREFYVTSRKAPFLYEGKYWTAERIRNLLVAPLETRNPIRWE
ncbi:MAG: hypothetical protein Q4A01_07695 [Coriobacteriales bacterium]|nr:hypothetical protein [Coriobacteriales bacterium]